MAQVSANAVVPFGDTATTNLNLILIEIKGTTATVELVTPYPTNTIVFSMNSSVYSAGTKFGSVDEAISFQGEQVKALTRVADTITSAVSTGLQYGVDGYRIASPSKVQVSSDLASCYYPYKVFSNIEVSYTYSYTAYGVHLNPTEDTHIGAVLTHPITGVKSYTYLTIPLANSSTEIVGTRTSYPIEVARPPYWWYYSQVGDKVEYLEYRAKLKVYHRLGDNSYPSVQGGGTTTQKPCQDTANPIPITSSKYITYESLQLYPTVSSRETVTETATFSASYFSPPSKPYGGFALTVIGATFIDSPNGSSVQPYLYVRGVDTTLVVGVLGADGQVTPTNNTVTIARGNIIATINNYAVPVTGTALVQYTTYYKYVPFESGGNTESPALITVTQTSTTEPASIVLNPPR